MLVCSNQLSTQIDQMQQACAKMAEPTASAPPESNNSCSVVLYVIDENRDINVWCDKVADVHRFIAGRSVAVNEMLQLGRRYCADRKRPILIKLFSAWDCRLLTNGAGKLKLVNI
jgi:hypothetical protein